MVFSLLILTEIIMNFQIVQETLLKPPQPPNVDFYCYSNLEHHISW